MLLFAAVKVKNIAEMARILAPNFREVIISTLGSFRRSETKATYAIFCKYNWQVYLEKEPYLALQKALALSENKLPIFATGSLYFTTELRKSAHKLFV